MRPRSGLEGRVLFNVKKVAFLFIAVTVAATAVFADDVFFPSTKGMVLTTANFSGKGKLEGYIRMSVRNVTGSGGNGTIVYTVQSLDKKMQPDKPKGELPQYVAPIVGGAVELGMEPWAALSGGKDIKITGTQMRLPSKLSPGDRIPDANLSMVMGMAVGKVTAEVSVTGQRCTGVESVTVPAGTFECYKVDRKYTTVADMVGKITFISNSTVWYARGIGAVKSFDYDEKGKLRSSSELHEIVR